MVGLSGIPVDATQSHLIWPFSYTHMCCLAMLITIRLLSTIGSGSISSFDGIVMVCPILNVSIFIFGLALTRRNMGIPNFQDSVPRVSPERTVYVVCLCRTRTLAFG